MDLLQLYYCWLCRHVKLAEKLTDKLTGGGEATTFNVTASETEARQRACARSRGGAKLKFHQIEKTWKPRPFSEDPNEVGRRKNNNQNDTS